MLRNNDSRVLGDVTSGLLCSLLNHETTETSQVNVLALCQGAFDNLHERLYAGQHGLLVDTGAF